MDTNNAITLKSELKGHKGSVNCLALFKAVINDIEQNKNIFAIDKSKLNEKQYLCSGGGNGDYSVMVWDYDSNKALRKMCGHTDGVTQIVALRDGVHIISSSQDTTIRVWDVLREKELEVIKQF